MGARPASGSQLSGVHSGSQGFTSGSHSANTLGMQASSQQQARSPSHSSASLHQRQLNEGPLAAARASMDLKSSKDMPTVPSRLSREHQALLAASDLPSPSTRRGPGSGN
jgi:hypothetical protein